MRYSLLFVLVLACPVFSGDLENARDRQDRAGLSKAAAERTQAAGNAKNAATHYDAALAHSYLSEVALELRDKAAARDAAQAGIKSARLAVELDPSKADYHRVLGTLCGQVIPADPLAGLQHGKCAKQEIEKALQLDPRSSKAWLAAGIGKFYLPPMFGGGVDIAMKDFQKAAELDPKLAEAWLWVGMAHRKSNRLTEARAAFQKALALNPQRVWIKQQLEKTPAQ